jgi:hypothetical protein
MVPLHSVQELLSALGVLDVLNTKVDTLLDVSVANNLVDDNTDGMWCHVVDDASSPVQITIQIKSQKIQELRRDRPMVEFVGHALLLGGVSFDVDDVTNVVVDEVRRHFNGAMV